MNNRIMKQSSNKQNEQSHKSNIYKLSLTRIRHIISNGSNFKLSKLTISGGDALMSEDIVNERIMNEVLLVGGIWRKR